MIGGGAGPRKLDLTRATNVRAHVDAMWPHVTDLARWPAWFRDARGHGLRSLEPLPSARGKVDPLQPELGQRYKLAFTNGLAGEFQVTYWVEPAQISLGMVKEAPRDGHGLEGFIIDCDLFPQANGTTKLWFGALLLLEKGFRPGPLARWPKREVQAWVDGFHERVAAEAPAWPKGRGKKASPTP